MSQIAAVSAEQKAKSRDLITSRFPERIELQTSRLYQPAFAHSRGHNHKVINLFLLDTILIDKVSCISTLNIYSSCRRKIENNNPGLLYCTVIIKIYVHG
jgi:hypothetical protein